MYRTYIEQAKLLLACKGSESFMILFLETIINIGNVSSHRNNPPI